MSRNESARGFGLALALLGAFGLAAPAARADEAGDAKGEAGGYVGSQVCVDCHEHEDAAKDLHFTTHGQTNKMNWDGATGCETCHGPGEAHAKSKGKGAGMINPGDLAPEEQSAICLQCHETSGHDYWQGGAHDGRNMSCLTCHVTHPKKEDVNAGLLKKGTVFDTCTSCHLQKKSTLMRSSHMPLREGSMTCTSCHNPHGGVGPSQLLQISVNENCYSCHAEKRSPMLWEHPPVKENCLNCHDPHGTMHQYLLKARVPRLCQNCHDEARHPTQPYDSAQTLRSVGTQPRNDGRFFPGTRLINHGCANCHSNIHGSNHPAGVRFMR